MRELFYNCYYKDTKITTVRTLKEAKEWKEKNPFNNYFEELLPIRKPETQAEKDKRLERIEKRRIAIKAKKK